MLCMISLAVFTKANNNMWITSLRDETKASSVCVFLNAPSAFLYVMSNFKDQVPLGPHLSSSYSLSLSLSRSSLSLIAFLNLYIFLSLSPLLNPINTLSLFTLSISQTIQILFRSLSLSSLFFSFLFNHLYVISNTPHTVVSKTKFS